MPMTSRRIPYYLLFGQVIVHVFLFRHCKPVALTGPKEKNPRGLSREILGATQ
jgi:hypothetical protein